MAKRIASTYGEALFELAVENHKEDLFLEQVGVVQTAMKENPDFAKLLHHPRISKEEKVQVIENVFKGRILDEITGFLTIVVEKERSDEMEEILTYFTDRIKEEKGIGVAYVKTATPITEIQKAQIKEKLLATTSYHEMEMYYSVDETLIGGMVIRIKDRVVDSSIKTKLSDLTRQLYKIQLG